MESIRLFQVKGNANVSQGTGNSKVNARYVHLVSLNSTASVQHAPLAHNIYNNLKSVSAKMATFPKMDFVGSNVNKMKSIQ